MKKRRKDRLSMMRMKIKEIAEAKGLTMTKLGRMADLNQRTMQAIYKDPYRDVAYSTLTKLAKALEVEVPELVEEVPDSDTH